MLDGIIPKFSGAGLVDYFGLAIGLTLGFTILAAPMKQLENANSKN